jgi:zinc/manganese transport system substrate-binding protein
MRTRFLALLFFLTAPLSAELRIVATTPDLADIARRVGGDFVKVDTLAKGTEDIHAVPQRPSFIPKLNHANAVVHLGLSAEHAFLPALIEAAANPNLLPGKQGDIDCSVHVHPKEVPSVISRAEGDQHPDGNPHYNVDPRNGNAIAQAIAEGFSRLDPAHADTFAHNRDAFDAELAAHIKDWKTATTSLKGIKAVSYHKDMVYFADFTGLTLVGEIEPKPGIAPTPKHLEELIGTMNAEKVSLILLEVQYSDQTPKWIASKTGAKIAVVGVMGGAFADSATYFGMIDHNVKSVLDALK